MKRNGTHAFLGPIQLGRRQGPTGKEDRGLVIGTAVSFFNRIHKAGHAGKATRKRLPARSVDYKRRRTHYRIVTKYLIKCV